MTRPADTTNEIARLSWPAFEQRAAATRLAVVPVGAVEPNGPHMALGLDNYVSTAVCRALAERTGALVAPLVPVGWSERLGGLPGVLDVPPDVVEAYCAGIARGLIDNGLDRVLFVLGHGGNTFAVDLVCHRLEREFPDSALAHVELWKYLQPLSEDLVESEEHRFGHAGEMPTSLMLHLHPELVDMSAAGVERPGIEPDPYGLVRPRPYPLRMPNGALGDTNRATAEKGRVLFERIVESLATFLLDDLLVKEPDGAPSPAGAASAVPD